MCKLSKWWIHFVIFYYYTYRIRVIYVLLYQRISPSNTIKLPIGRVFSLLNAHVTKENVWEFKCKIYTLLVFPPTLFNFNFWNFIARQLLISLLTFNFVFSRTPYFISQPLYKYSENFAQEKNVRAYFGVVLKILRL